MSQAPELKPINDEVRNALDVALELKKQSMERFFQRRQIEWRVSLALWGAIAVVGTAARDLNLSPCALAWLTVPAIVLTAGHALWAWAYNHRAAVDNRRQGYQLENVIRERIGLDPVPDKSYLSFWAHYWPAAITGMLSAAVILLIAAS
jgi:hypothetical protein